MGEASAFSPWRTDSEIELGSRNGVSNQDSSGRNDGENVSEIISRCDLADHHERLLQPETRRNSQRPTVDDQQPEEPLEGRAVMAERTGDLSEPGQEETASRIALNIAARPTAWPESKGSRT
jgi:hypothetical protein